MSKRRILKLDVDRWFADRALRLCSPGARGFLVDLRALCCPSGVLAVDGRPLDDKQLAALTGLTVAAVRGFMRELGPAGAYDVTDDQFLCFPDMVADAAFVAQARNHGAKGGRRKHKVREERPIISHTAVAQLKTDIEAGNRVTELIAVAPRRPAAPWYKSPAGWVRMGNQHAMSMKPEEDIEAFRLRVSLKIPLGPHLEMLTPGQMKQWEAAQPPPPAEPKPRKA